MSVYGLKDEEVRKSREEFGSNGLSQPPRESFWQKLLGNFQDPIIKILLLALLVNVVCVFRGYGDWYEAGGIFLAIILATMVSTFSEYSNENAFQKLQEEASRITCRVWRNGKLVELPIDELVVGDAIVLETGDKIPVDGVLLEGVVKLDQAALNGESEEAEKLAAPKGFVWPKEVDFLDEHCLYRGSVVVEGTGILEARQVGDNSVYGKLTQELKDDDRDSPLKLKLKHLANTISKFGYVGSVCIALGLMLHRMLLAGGWDAYMANLDIVLADLVQAVILAVIIIVMAVPEGLPLMIAIVSSLNMRKMLDDKVLVRKLVGIETAGSLNLLFTDKTGTITKGKLEVMRFLNGKGEEFSSFEALPGPIQQMVYENVALNTSASISQGQLVGGNMTEVALNNYVGSFKGSLPKRLDFIPFNSTAKCSYAKVQGEGCSYRLVKGAPEKLLQKAAYYYNSEGQREPLTDEMKEVLDRRMLEYAGQTMRLLALCCYKGNFEPIDGKTPWEQGGVLSLAGIVAIRDDVRPEAVEAIDAVQKAGVQVVMITGDRKETAVAIAKSAGLLRNDEDLALTSGQLASLSDEEVKELLPRLRVVARALPMDKSRLVRLSQELNLVVGMTGDGVNDSPALKKADVGFAMGSGTEVAKEAGDIVILDDNFLSIKKAILYGRTIYHSICKFITFQLSINFSAVAINFIAPFVGIEKPLTITQILWINLVMDTLAALAFGGEPALEQYLTEPPKKRSAPIVSKKMLISIFSSGIYITFLALAFFKCPFITERFRAGIDDIYLYTGFFCTYILLAVANGFNVRVDNCRLWEHLQMNKGFIQVMALIVCVQIVLTYVGGRILRTAPLNMDEWLTVIGLSVTIIFVDVIRKLLTK